MAPKMAPAVSQLRSSLQQQQQRHQQRWHPQQAVAIVFVLIFGAFGISVAAPAWDRRVDTPTAITGDAIPTKNMFDFMRRYGYLEKGPSHAEALYSEEAVVAAIKNIQKYGALPETGMLDARTVQVGVPDGIPSKKS